MITALSAPVIGANSFSGIWTPEAVTIGRSKAASPSVVIDLTASQLDSRLVYTGPAHSYMGADGKLRSSVANQWPLEYVNGVVSGRHEPEPAATNYVPGVEYGKISRGNVADDWNYGSTATPVIAPSDFGPAAATTTATGVLTAVYSEGTSGFIAPTLDGGSPSQWSRITRKFTNAGSATLRWYVSRVDSNDYLFARCNNVPAGQFVASVYRRVTANGLLSAAAQLEPGSIATSPIISAAGVQGKRAASSVAVQTAGFASLLIHFSDGTTKTHQITGDTFTLPVATKNWGERYIQRIEMRK